MTAWPEEPPPELTGIELELEAAYVAGLKRGDDRADRHVKTIHDLLAALVRSNGGTLTYFCSDAVQLPGWLMLDDPHGRYTVSRPITGVGIPYMRFEATA